MRLRISIRGLVRPSDSPSVGPSVRRSVRPSVRPSVPCYFRTMKNVIFEALTTTTCNNDKEKAERNHFKASKCKKMTFSMALMPFIITLTIVIFCFLLSLASPSTAYT